MLFNWLRKQALVELSAASTDGLALRIGADEHHLHITESVETTTYAWSSFIYARWIGDEQRIEFTFIDPQQAPLVFEIGEADATDFMDVVRHGISRALVHSELHTLSNGTSLTIVVLREPNGELFSLVVANGPVPEQLNNEVLVAENAVREVAGLPPLKS